MNRSPLRDRITDQFSYRGERADIWRAFDLILDTGAFLNLGYSEWYQPHVVGSSQRRLVEEVGSWLASDLPVTDGTRVLDVGCGRGGPAVYLAERFGFRVTGVDLVPYNVERATANAREKCVETDFAVGDATQLPFAADSFAACTAIDALVYFPDRETVFAAVADVLEPGGVFVISDLLMRSDVNEKERRIVDRFADTWDMPSLGTVEQYKRTLEDTTLDLSEIDDITRHSVGRFRKWTTLFRWLVTSPMGYLVERLLRIYGLDPAAIFDQVERVHHALPYLRHVILVGRNES